MEETDADQHGNVCGADLNTRLAPRCSTGKSWARTIIGADDRYAQISGAAVRERSFAIGIAMQVDWIIVRPNNQGIAESTQDGGPGPAPLGSGVAAFSGSAKTALTATALTAESMWLACPMEGRP